MTTFGAEVEAALPEFRALAESRMTSRVTIRRGGVMVVNPDTGLEEPGWADVHVDVPFRLDGGSSGDGGSRTVTIGGTEFEQATAVGHLPANTADLEDNDLILVTAGEWSGSVWQIVEAVKKDQATARRVPIVETTAPTEWDES